MKKIRLNYLKIFTNAVKALTIYTIILSVINWDM